MSVGPELFDSPPVLLYFAAALAVFFIIRAIFTGLQ
jgi:hypothetical protein